MRQLVYDDSVHSRVFHFIRNKTQGAQLAALRIRAMFPAYDVFYVLRTQYEPIERANR